MFKDMRVDFYNKTDKQRKRVLLYRKDKILKSDNELLKKMCSIVEKKVKKHRSDFYIHDVETIKDCEGEPFLWLVREQGTHYIKLYSERFTHTGKWENRLCFDFISHHFGEVDVYFYIDGQLKKVTKAQAKEILNAYEEEIRDNLKIYF